MATPVSSENLTSLGPTDLADCVVRFRDALRAHQEELNRLNVYPVPDGDTGTNMALTLESVAKELASTRTMGEVCTAISRGSLMGARGNSGVITSQILRGFTEVCAPLAEIGASDVVAAMRRAADAAYEAVLRPVEGTILTVVRETTEALERYLDANPAATLADVVIHAYDAADASVLRTPQWLPVLADAGVVDSGGRGFTLLLASIREVATGVPVPEPSSVATPLLVERHLAGDDVANLRYEVMFLLDAQDALMGRFKDSWGAIGDSIVVVGGDGLWNCHVHTNDIGAAIEAGIQAGRPREIRVTDLFEEAVEHAWVMDHAEGGDGPDYVTTAIVAVGVGEGINRLLRSLGVQSIVAGGQSMNPSTAQILEAVEACRSDSVIVLPNNKNIIPVAKQVDALTERNVAVVPTTSVIEALSALIDYDPDGAISQNVAALTENMERVRTGEVTQAVRDSVGECGPIKEGDWLAITREGIIAATASPFDAVMGLLAHLVDDDSEIITVILGAASRSADADRIRTRIGLDHPHVEVEFHAGGQPLYPYLVGVE